jgi:hypothetical protein
MDESKRRPFYLYIDEFHNFITPSMASILSGARKYGLGLVMAHQELRQLWNRDADVASAVLANPCARVCFRVGDWDAAKLAEGFSSFEAKDLQNLNRGEAICRIDKANWDFNMSSIAWHSLLETQGPEWKQRIRAVSRERYAVPLESVLESIREENTATSTPHHDTPAPKAPVSKLRPQKEVPAKATPPEQGSLSAELTPGKGGPAHKYLQNLVKSLAEDMGYGATIEQGILDGRGSVDVVLKRADFSIACQITITTPADYELEGLKKCVEAGFQKIALVSPNRRSLNQIKELANTAIGEADRSRLHFFTPEEFLLFLEELDAVKTSFRSMTEKEKEAKKQSITQTIFSALKRLKGG